MPGISDVLRAARERAGLSQDDLVQRGAFDRAHVSRAERGVRGMSFEKIDRWLAVCGVTLAVVPLDQADPAEITSLPGDLRELILRLARLLPALRQARPEMMPEILDDIHARMDRWERTYLASTSDPTSHDTRASSSKDRRIKSS